MKKIIVLATVFVLSLISGPVFGQEYYGLESETVYGNDDERYYYEDNDPSEFELNANQDIVEGVYHYTWRNNPSLLTNIDIGITAIHNVHDYTLLGLHIAWVNEKILHNLRIDMGFKGVGGTVEKNDLTGDMRAISFRLTGEYDLPWDITDDGNEDFSLRSHLSFSPSSLSFSDAESYLHFKTNFDFHIIPPKKGSIVLGYRALNVGFEDNSRDLDVTDSGVFLGFKLKF
jgi:hypothetical protein